MSVLPGWGIIPHFRPNRLFDIDIADSIVNLLVCIYMECEDTMEDR